MSTLNAFALYFPIENLLIPPSAYVTDRRRLPDIYVPYASGKRAFGTRNALPTSSSSGGTFSTRLVSYVLLALQFISPTKQSLHHRCLHLVIKSCGFPNIIIGYFAFD